ncbi:CPBP family intramembrane metalloprotease [Candidatus Fermentibacteria bacterium]|nr:CPBP family intramembrane metalloprotease [Candidatus Fermentibacteria bacterium]
MGRVPRNGVAAARRSTEVIKAICRAEFTMLLRDRRTIVVSIVLPLFITPLLMFGSRWVQERRERRLATMDVRYAVTGSAHELAHDLIARAAAADTAGLLLLQTATSDPAQSLAEGELDLFVEALSPGEAWRDTTERDEISRGDTAAVPTLILHFREDRDTSERGARMLRRHFDELRRAHRVEMLESRGLAEMIGFGVVERHDLAGARQVAGLHIGRYLVLFVMLFMLSGGSVVAVDTLAGEKERGTLETLLTTAASRADIVAAKHLVILAVALIIAVIQSLNFLAYVALKLIPLPQGFVLDVPPEVTALIFVLLIPLAALVSGVLLLTSGYARSYKEAQLYFFPVLLIGIVPAVAPFLPGLSLRSAAVLVPIANIALAIKEVLVGRYDWPFIVAAWAVTAAAAWYVRRLAERVLSTERLIVPTVGESGQRSGEAVFTRRVLPAFAIMWAVFFIFASNVEGRMDLRIELLVNLVVIFFGGSLLLIRMHRLSARRVFAFRPVRAWVWPLVAIGAPAGLLAAAGVFRLASLVLPVPKEMLEAFGKGLMPEEIPFWQLVLFIAVLPGVFEELTFRGTLLYGLRKSLHPVPLVLVVGAVFGLFHVALFRIVPTAFIGIVLSGVTLLTGSVFPAMLWHALNNGLSIALGHFELDLAELTTLHYAGAALILLAVFAALWRIRTPYPELRTSRE